MIMKNNSQNKSFLRTICLLLLVSIVPFLMVFAATASENGKKNGKKSKIKMSKLKKEIHKAMKSIMNHGQLLEKESFITAVDIFNQYD